MTALLPFAASAEERIPNDPLFNEQWYLHKIAVSQAWGTTLGFEGITVAVIDSGVDVTHPDLKDNIWINRDEIPGNGVDDDLNGYVDDVRGWDFVGRDNDPAPSLEGIYTALGANHGTITAGIIAARGDNGKGMTGVTWQTAIMPLRALDSNGTGDPMNVVQAVEYAVKNGAKVINLGFVGPSNNELLRIAVKSAYDAGVVVVAAAGNAGEDGVAADLAQRPLYPVCLDRGDRDNFIIGVAATDEFDKLASFSNYGSGCVDISAPGSRVISTTAYRPGSKDFSKPYSGYFNGTSVAAPMVSGAAALLLSLNPQLTPSQVMATLGASAAPVKDAAGGIAGRGRIDIGAAVRSLMSSLAASAKVQPTDELLPTPEGRMIAVAPGAGREPEIRFFTPDGLFVRSFNAFPKDFRGGVSLAAGDFGDDGLSQIVAAPKAGGLPQVRIFDRNTRETGTFLAFDAGFKGGVSVAAGDVVGDAKDEIVVAAGPGGGPHVRVFNARGQAVAAGFFAFEQTFKGGISVAAGDVDGDGRDDIVVVSGAGRSLIVRIFDVKGRQKGEFLPFGKTERRGGTVTVQDVDGDGSADIIVSLAVKSAKPTAFTFAGKRLGAFDAVRAAFEKGVAWTFVVQPQAVAALPLGAPPSVTIFDKRRSPLQFRAFEAKFAGGVSAIIFN